MIVIDDSRDVLSGENRAAQGRGEAPHRVISGCPWIATVHSRNPATSSTRTRECPGRARVIDQSSDHRTDGASVEALRCKSERRLYRFFGTVPWERVLSMLRVSGFRLCGRVAVRGLVTVL